MLNLFEAIPAFCCIFFARSYPMQKKDVAAIGAKIKVINIKYLDRNLKRSLFKNLQQFYFFVFPA